MRRDLVRWGLVAVLLAVAGVACSSATTTTAPSATTASTTTTVKASGKAAGGGAGGDASQVGGGSGSAGAGETQIGLTADDVERLRTIYLQKGIDADVTDCVVNDTVQSLEGQAVTQELLESALATAGTKCGGGGGGNLVQSIIDNYPTGGPVSSTTTTYP